LPRNFIGILELHTVQPASYSLPTLDTAVAAFGAENHVSIDTKSSSFTSTQNRYFDCTNLIQQLRMSV